MVLYKSKLTQTCFKYFRVRVQVGVPQNFEFRVQVRVRVRQKVEFIRVRVRSPGQNKKESPKVLCSFSGSF